ncbi:tyrosine-type recombinase/integrase [Staphylococcus sp. IVB6181]|uniref:tyrosine-type recombinase/integrase n=1 Tax=Staphylococcus sp. IVB6181 TaxID=2929481 RepID=UPI0029349104|nr:tyrosine-type recombinase/integrase [Staphylococcus sp. IVB6181]
MKNYYLNRRHYFAASTYLILLMIETGGRFSDCIYLKRKHINEVTNTIFLDGNKNKHAKRTVKVAKECIDLLITFANNHPSSSEGYLFTHNGKLITNESINKSIKQACSTLKIKRNITSHAFRHTHASYLISQNINIYYISKRLGHSDISMTLNKYGHLLEEVREKDEDKTISLLRAL